MNHNKIKFSPPATNSVTNQYPCVFRMVADPNRYVLAFDERLGVIVSDTDVNFIGVILRSDIFSDTKTWAYCGSVTLKIEFD